MLKCTEDKLSEVFISLPEPMKGKLFYHYFDISVTVHHIYK